MSLARKAINFDLDTNELEKYFDDTREPYNQIKKFMLENDFTHKQYSGYASKNPMSNREISRISSEMIAKFEWLAPCLKVFDVTNIGKQYDLTEKLKDLGQKYKKEAKVKALKSKVKKITKTKNLPNKNINNLTAIKI